MKRRTIAFVLMICPFLFGCCDDGHIIYRVTLYYQNGQTKTCVTDNVRRGEDGFWYFHDTKAGINVKFFGKVLCEPLPNYSDFPQAEAIASDSVGTFSGNIASGN